MPVTQPLSSNLDAILNQCVTMIEGLGLTYTPPGGTPTLIPVVKRKLSKKDETIDPLPLITVWPIRDAENARWLSFSGWLRSAYNIGIAIIAANDGDEFSNIPTLATWRQSIRQLFQGPALGNLTTITDSLGNVSKILDVDSSKDEFLDNKMLPDLYDYQTVGVFINIVEPSAA